eukprot:GHVQ01020631.1.p1 GENE.GHVQ01020631.1~~GHVQ01020631.1.p1  ORF type:complete len:392 (-),score=63.58 GHVQ01020631.1:738-1913(-)
MTMKDMTKRLLACTTAVRVVCVLLLCVCVICAVIEDNIHNSHIMSRMSASREAESAPVFEQLDSSVPKSSRTADVSYLREKKPFLPCRLPTSLIPEQDHINQKTFFPEVGSTYKETDGMWHSVMFPSNRPSSRLDAVMLDKWISQALERHARQLGTKEDLATAVEELVPVLSIGLHELVRQVSHHCVERGLVLEKVWRTYVELFDRILKETKTSLTVNRDKTNHAEHELSTCRDTLDDLRKKHPQQMQMLITTFQSKFAQHQKELEDRLASQGVQTNACLDRLKSLRNDIEIFFPSFSIYSSSAALRQELMAATPVSPKKETDPLETVIGEDIKRLLSVMTTEQRKKLKALLSPLLGFSRPPNTSTSTEEELQAKIQQLEEENRRLKEGLM